MTAPDAHREHEGARVLDVRRAILLDAVEAVQRALELPHEVVAVTSRPRSPSVSGR